MSASAARTFSTTAGSLAWSGRGWRRLTPVRRISRVEMAEKLAWLPALCSNIAARSFSEDTATAMTAPQLDALCITTRITQRASAGEAFDETRAGEVQTSKWRGFDRGVWVGMNTTATEVLIRAAETARLAPSIHNTQPWRWVVRGDRLELFAVAARQLREQDPQGRLMQLSCGAALHHALVALTAEGWVYDVDRPGGEALAVIHAQRHE